MDPATCRPPAVVHSLALALAMLVGAACDRPREDPIVVRFVEDDPPALFDPSVLSSSDPALEWSFEGDDAQARFDEIRFASGSGTLRLGGVYISAKKKEVLIELPGPIETNAVDTVIVTLPGFTGGEVGLRWMAPDGKVHLLSRKISPQRRAADGAYALSLRSHSGWTGEARQPRLSITCKRSKRVVLRSIVAVRHELRPDKLEAAVGQAWKVDLGEVRSALLAPPGLRISRRLEIPEGLPVLSFAYGMTAVIERPVVFRVLAERDGSGAEEVLWEQTMAGEKRRRRRSKPRWQLASVDLSPFAGTDMTMVLETAVEGERLDPLAGLPVWGHPEVARTAPGAKPNIILISIDTLRADRLSVYGYPRMLTPGLDAWTRRYGVVFENAVVSAPWTLPSTMSMLTGVDAIRHGVNQLFATASSELTLLADYLRDNNYWTAAITGGAFLNPKFGFYRGHDVYYYSPDQAANQLERNVALANEWLGEMREPFFLFFHTYSVHSPYRARQPYYDELSGGAAPPPGRVIPSGGGFVTEGSDPEPVSPDVARDMYDSGVAHMDAQMNLLFRRIEELGLRGRTMIIFTSDHGEALGEGGRSGHGLLQDHNLLVPLVLELPDGSGAGRTVLRQVRSVDIVPTILDTAGLDPMSDLDGVSLLPLLQDGAEPRVPSVAVTYAPAHGISLRVRNRMKYIFRNAAWAKAGEREELYLLEADPGEANDVAAIHPEKVADLRTQAQHSAAQAPGLWIRLSNGGPGTLSGNIRGVGLSQGAVKSPDISCPCVKLVSAGHLSFEVPPGVTYHLVLESTDAGKLALEGNLEAAPSAPSTFRQEVDLRGAAARVAFHHSAADWSRGEQALPAGATGIELWREGKGSGSDTAPEADSELTDQLRALGYLD